MCILLRLGDDVSLYELLAFFVMPRLAVLISAFFLLALLLSLDVFIFTVLSLIC